MNTYEFSISMAIWFFPFIALLFTFPYCLFQYHKYGAMIALKIMAVYSFVLYLLVLYFLVILPLPSKAEVATYTSPTMQLRPFTFVSDIVAESNFATNNIMDLFKSLKNFAVFQTIANVVMMIPFGIYMRYYFKHGFICTILLSFLLSLFFELTQLSGLYGIYPRPYRLFDTDDLITNTTGGMVGYLAAPLFSFFLPTRDKLDIKAYQKGKAVTFTRRIFALITDWGIMFFGLLVVYVAYDLHPAGFQRRFPWILTVHKQLLFLACYLSYGLLLTLIPLVTRGRTLGKWAVKTQVCDVSGKPASPLQLLFRSLLFYGIVAPAPYYIYRLLSWRTLSSVTALKYFFLLLLLALVAMYCCYFYEILYHIITRNGRYLHEILTRTKCISNVQKKNP